MDDDEDILEAVGEMMAGVGFEVYRASSGNEVLARYIQVIKLGLKVKVFLLDNQVPGCMGGIATAEKLRELGSLAQIIIMSGHFDGVTTAVASELDGLWRLAKPFTKEELDQVLCSEVPEV
jgi:FixJ family two-component response regulator